jgi:hypothetical protein
MIRILILTIAFFTFVSCNNGSQSATEGETTEANKTKAKPISYTSKEIGWTIEIPEGWKIEDQQKLKADIDEGKKVLEKKGIDLSISGHEINLVTFRKNQLSKLQSTAIPYKEEYKGSWKDAYLLIKKQIYDGFNSLGVKVDSVSNQAEIDGLKFEVFVLTIHDKKDRILMHQLMYRTLIKGFDFVINITYDEDMNGIEVMEAWKKSKFDKGNPGKVKNM